MGNINHSHIRWENDTEEVTKEVKIGGSLGCSDHVLVKFGISRNMGLAKSRQDPELQEREILSILGITG